MFSKLSLSWSDTCLSNYLVVHSLNRSYSRVCQISFFQKDEMSFEQALPSWKFPITSHGHADEVKVQSVCHIRQSVPSFTSFCPIKTLRHAATTPPLSILARLLSLIPLYKTKNQTLVSTINHPTQAHNMLQIRPTFILGALMAALLVSTAMASRDKTTCNDCQNRLAACAKVRIIT